jgi:flagellar biosynthesis/type III secretory pathway chaperone
MDNQQLVQLQETLRASIHVAQEFSQLLESEKKQLTSTERDAVNSLLEQKQRLIQQLSEYQSKILHFCKTNKIEPTYGAVRSLLYRLGIDNVEAILADWTLLKNALVKNQALNKTNEAILNELIRRNQIKQAIVNNLGRQSDTYSAAGQKHSRTEQGWVEQV